MPAVFSETVRQFFLHPAQGGTVPITQIVSANANRTKLVFAMPTPVFGFTQGVLTTKANPEIGQGIGISSYVGYNAPGKLAIHELFSPEFVQAAWYAYELASNDSKITVFEVFGGTFVPFGIDVVPVSPLRDEVLGGTVPMISNPATGCCGIDYNAVLQRNLSDIAADQVRIDERISSIYAKYLMPDWLAGDDCDGETLAPTVSM